MEIRRRPPSAAAGGGYGAGHRTAIRGWPRFERAREGRSSGAPGSSGNGACGDGCKAWSRPTQLEPRTVTDAVPEADATAGVDTGAGAGAGEV